MESKKQVFLPILIILCLAWFTEAGWARSETVRLCHVCDTETCKNFDVKKSTPRNCTAEFLNPENSGPSQLFKMSYIGFAPSSETDPQFVCQKVEGTDRMGNVNIVRRCQLKLDGNESCDTFYREIQADRANTYHNVSCLICDKDGCNSSGTSYIWISLLFGSCIFSIFNNFNALV